MATNTKHSDDFFDVLTQQIEDPALIVEILKGYEEAKAIDDDKVLEYIVEIGDKYGIDPGDVYEYTSEGRKGKMPIATKVPKKVGAPPKVAVVAPLPKAKPTTRSTTAAAGAPPIVSLPATGAASTAPIVSLPPPKAATTKAEAPPKAAAAAIKKEIKYENPPNIVVNQSLRRGCSNGIPLLFTGKGTKTDGNCFYSSLYLAAVDGGLLDRVIGALGLEGLIGEDIRTHEGFIKAVERNYICLFSLT